MSYSVINTVTLLLVCSYCVSTVRGQSRRCPEPEFENGRYRLRSGGRIAKFTCSRGYYMLGSAVANCINGQWSPGIPACARPGCIRPDPPANGRLVNKQSGSVLFTECDPGYQLSGPQTLFCDGFRWNGTVPTCSASGTKPDLFCDFENRGLCGWMQDPLHDFDWIRTNFGTPSSNIGTGPSFDHTLGEGKNGYYLYTEASAPRLENNTARLFSPIYGADLISQGCFLFWYHMYGATIGHLRVYVKAESSRLNQLNPSFIKSGNQGNRWLRGLVQLPANVSENFQIVIESVRGKSYLSDIAIDDVMVGQGDQCKMAHDSTTNAATDGEDGNKDSLPVDQSCSSRCGSPGANETCDCRSSCLIEDTCCSDYTQFCLDVNDQPPEEYVDSGNIALGFGDVLTLGLILGGIGVTLAGSLTAMVVCRRQGQRSRVAKDQRKLPEDSDVRYLREDDEIQLDLTEATPAKFANLDQL